MTTGKIESNVRLGANVHGNGDYEEILMIEKNALEDEAVKAEIAKLDLPAGAIVCADPWIYGMDSTTLSLLADFFQALMVWTTTRDCIKSSCT